MNRLERVRLLVRVADLPPEVPSVGAWMVREMMRRHIANTVASYAEYERRVAELVERFGL